MLRTRITLLVAATTSAVVLAFVVPLGLLVRTQAEDRLVATVRQRAQAVAMVVAGGGAGPALDAAMAGVPGDPDATTPRRHDATTPRRHDATTPRPA